ncbi:hypothetical protein [Blautia sp. MSJ-9]|uniref:hypothetical protein n=1 Tax=Blautia sp. MSJ-9 TaxID=2841511 RepID=UPI001C0F7289|nr:hypothetical protein [Blautia sp. MSJ-9]MBU5680137.1 hypothetical protein [Blautia sp. MSJ-9]
MKQKLGPKHRLMAYVLSTDADLNSNKNITQKEIGHLFGVSQSTIAQAVKETKLQLKIHELEEELSQAKSDVVEMEDVKKLGIPDFVESKYKRKP